MDEFSQKALHCNVDKSVLRQYQCTISQSITSSPELAISTCIEFLFPGVGFFLSCILFIAHQFLFSYAKLFFSSDTTHSSCFLSQSFYSHIVHHVLINTIIINYIALPGPIVNMYCINICCMKVKQQTEINT